MAYTEYGCSTMIEFCSCLSDIFDLRSERRDNKNVQVLYLAKTDEPRKGFKVASKNVLLLLRQSAEGLNVSELLEMYEVKFHYSTFF